MCNLLVVLVVPAYKARERPYFGVDAVMEDGLISMTGQGLVDLLTRK